MIDRIEPFYFRSLLRVLPVVPSQDRIPDDGLEVVLCSFRLSSSRAKVEEAFREIQNVFVSDGRKRLGVEIDSDVSSQVLRDLRNRLSAGLGRRFSHGTAGVELKPGRLIGGFLVVRVLKNPDLELIFFKHSLCLLREPPVELYGDAHSSTAPTRILETATFTSTTGIPWARK